MANLSNINNILRTSSLGVGINCDAEFSLDVEKASANAILSLNSNGGSGAEYILSSTTSGEFVLNKRYVGDRLTISSGGDATFAGDVIISRTGGNDAKLNLLTDGAGGSESLIYFSDTTDGAGRIRYDHNDGSPDEMSFYTASTKRFYINGSGNATFAGNVKITGNQEKVLELDSSADSGAIHFEEGGTLRGILGFSNGTTITSSAADNDMVLRSEANLLLTTNASTLALKLDTSQNATFAGTVKGTIAMFDTLNNNANSANIIYRSGTSTLVGGGSTGNKLYVLDSGNVGIKTTSPAGLLTIKGTGDAIRVESTNTGAGGAQMDLLHFTTSPADGDTFALINMGGYYTGTTSVYGTSIKSIWTDVSARDAALTFSTNNSGTLTEATRIQSNGNVLIGTTGITNTRLKVVQSTASEWACQITHTGTTSYGLAIDTSANSGVYALGVYTNTGGGLFVKNDGKVGIGTTAPLQKLHVEGTTATIHVQSTTANQNASIWFNSNVGGTQANRWEIGTNISAASDLEFFDRLNSVSRMVIQNDGNVGIGTISPASKLQVRIGGIGSNANDEVDGVIFEGDRHDLIFKQIRTAASSDWNSTTFRLQNRVDTTLMSSIDFVTDASFNRHIDINTASNSFNTRFTHDGKVGIGYTNPGSKLSVNGDGGFVSNSSSRVLYLTQNATNAGNIIQFLDQSGNNVWELVGRNSSFYIYNNQNSVGYVFESNASNGHVAILKGGTDASYPLDVTGTIRSTADVIAYSDRRVKENIKTIDNALDKVIKLRGVSYNRKDIDDKSTKIGVIAQEVKEILPEVVENDLEDKYSVAYGNMAGLFIEAIKELKAEIEELKKHSCDCKK